MEGLVAPHVKAVSFADAAPRPVPITSGQQLLLNLLQRRLEEGRPITGEDIFELYVKACIPGRVFYRWDNNYRWDHEKNQWQGGTRERKVDDPALQKYFSGMARRWFMSNLGACVLKGRLLALPVIDIDHG